MIMAQFILAIMLGFFFVFVPYFIEATYKNVYFKKKQKTQC